MTNELKTAAGKINLSSAERIQQEWVSETSINRFIADVFAMNPKRLMVKAWSNGLVERIYPIIYLDGIYANLHLEGHIDNVDVYVVLAVALDSRRDMRGFWVCDGTEDAKFWLSVLNDLKARGPSRILSASVEGRNGFKEALHAAFPQTRVQR